MTGVSDDKMEREINLWINRAPNVIKNRTLDRVGSFKLLGTWISKYFKKTYHINQIVSSCYKILATVRRIKNMTPQNINKNLAQSLVLSKLNFSNSETYSLPQFLQKKAQRVQNAAASCFCSEKDVLMYESNPTAISPPPPRQPPGNLTFEK
jgi:hypothetical protein